MTAPEVMAYSRVFNLTDVMCHAVAAFSSHDDIQRLVGVSPELHGAIPGVISRKSKEFFSDISSGEPSRLGVLVYAPLLCDIHKLSTPASWGEVKKEEMVARKFFTSLADQMGVSSAAYSGCAALKVFDREALDALMLGFHISDEDKMPTARKLISLVAVVNASLDLPLQQALSDIDQEETVPFTPVTKAELVESIGEESLTKIIKEVIPKGLPDREVICFTKVPRSVIAGTPNEIKQRYRLVLEFAYLNACLSLCEALEKSLPKPTDTPDVLAKKTKQRRELAERPNALFIFSSIKTKLQLSGRKLQALCPEVKTYPFTVLDLSNNLLGSVPALSSSIKHVNLSRNPLVRFHSYKYMEHLQGLAMAEVGLRTVPKEVADIQLLHTLDLRGNKLVSLPHSLDALSCLLVEGNPLVYIHPSIIEKHLDSPRITEVPITACHWVEKGHRTPKKGIDIDVRAFLEEMLYEPQSVLGRLYKLFVTDSYDPAAIAKVLAGLDPDVKVDISKRAYLLQGRLETAGPERTEAIALEDLPLLALAVRSYIIEIFEAKTVPEKELILAQVGTLSMRSSASNPLWVKDHAKDVISRLADGLASEATESTSSGGTAAALVEARVSMDEQMSFYEELVACKDTLHYFEKYKADIAHTPSQQHEFVSKKVKLALKWNDLILRKKRLDDLYAPSSKTTPSLISHTFEEVEFMMGVFCPEPLNLLYYQVARLERMIQPIFDDNYLGTQFAMEWHYSATSAQGRMLQHMVTGPFDFMRFFSLRNELTPMQRTLFEERVYREQYPLNPLPEPEVISHWAELHLLDDMALIGVALQRSILEQLEKLPAETKAALLMRISAESGVDLAAAPDAAKRCLSRLADLL